MRRELVYLLPLALALLSGVLPGCHAPEPPPQDRADVAVEAFLNGWVRGESKDSWNAPGQPIQATDPDWNAGSRLMSFLIAKTTPADGKPNQFRCQVSLSLKNPRGKTVEKGVVYEVTLGETTVIARAAKK